VTPINFQLEKINSRYEGWVFDYAEVVDVEHDKLEAAQDRHAGGKGRSASHYPGVMVAWDNEARKPEKGNVFHDSRPSLYRKWLASAADATIRMNPAEERFVFINAWNEWAEGAYLEPDRRFGYGCLAATADVLREASADKDAIRALAARSNHGTRRADTAICLHIYYPEMIGEFVEAIAAARRQLPIDVILTIPDTWTLADAQDAVARLEPVRVIPSPNRGRDVLPFLLAMREGLRLGYKFGCKVHSKKSPQLSDGDAWRRRLIDGLLCPDALTAVKAGLQKNKRIVLAAPAEEFAGMADDYVMQDNMRRSRELMSSLGFADAPMDEFVAGTMFWFRFSALEPMARLACNESHFGPELGQLDGTLAHAFERVFVPFAKASGGEIDRYDISRQSRKQESTR
jgi:lipopolysaccharide biosynthesis protein